jgi:tetratricopeptide (TPR) repeat protein
MRSLKINAREYLELYNSSKQIVMDMLPPSEANPMDPARASVRSTWTVSIGILKSRMASETEDDGLHQRAYRLLHLLAFFDPSDLAYEIMELANISDEVPSWYRNTFQTKAEFVSVTKVLLDLSLIDRTFQSGSYSMHRALHNWLCVFAAQDTTGELLNLSASAICRANIYFANTRRWEDQERLVLHVNVIYPRLQNATYNLESLHCSHNDNQRRQRSSVIWGGIHPELLKAGRVYPTIGGISNILCYSGRSGEALRLIQDSLDRIPRDARDGNPTYFGLLYKKAHVSLILEDYGTSKSLVQAALDGFVRLEMTPWVVAAHVLQANLLRLTGQHEKAIELLLPIVEGSRTLDGSIFAGPAWSAFCALDLQLKSDGNRRKQQLESVKLEAEAAACGSANARFALRDLAWIYVEFQELEEAERLLKLVLRCSMNSKDRDTPSIKRAYEHLATFYRRFHKSRPEKMKEAIEWCEEWYRIVTIRHGTNSTEVAMALAARREWETEISRDIEGEREFGASGNEMDPQLCQ